MRAIGDGFSTHFPLPSEGEIEVLGADPLAFELSGSDNGPVLPSEEASSGVDKYVAAYLESSKLLWGLSGSVVALQSYPQNASSFFSSKIESNFFLNEAIVSIGLSLLGLDLFF